MQYSAQRLRDLTCLPVQRLATIFGVSRQIYYRWLTTNHYPTNAHYEHLLEVLPLVEEAAQRLGLPTAVRTWLLTPTTPGGKKPIDYLAERSYDTFRGFLLRGQTEHIAIRSREDREAVLHRLRPPAFDND